MRFTSYFCILVCFMLTFSLAKPTLPDRLVTAKSSTGQKYALLKPVSAALSYLYYSTQPVPTTSIADASRNKLFNTDYTGGSYLIKEQDNGYGTKQHIIDNSSTTVDVNRQNGPVTALALVLFFCVLTF